MAEVNDGFEFMITFIGFSGHDGGLVVFEKRVGVAIELDAVDPSTFVLPRSQRPAADEIGAVFFAPILVDDSTAADARVFFSKADGVVDEVITGLEQHQDILRPILVHISYPVPRTL